MKVCALLLSKNLKIWKAIFEISYVRHQWHPPNCLPLSGSRGLYNRTNSITTVVILWPKWYVTLYSSIPIIHILYLCSTSASGNTLWGDINSLIICCIWKEFSLLSPTTSLRKMLYLEIIPWSHKAFISCHSELNPYFGALKLSLLMDTNNGKIVIGFCHWVTAYSLGNYKQSLRCQNRKNISLKKSD